ncbi:hypothetical protein BU14_0023s0067 [Porphyra umbilicalis]|uniref:Uncharacterized protein n=1 Tax=Porphyra umbilicalis TaxID=2786 RepID=A0A1X6PKT2_PORUM|nr:hypothetical protein BU14_0023s0067 [Porphyra umbilicalis]|eukprot:OSX81263.1 hypothetical protein BU14_0023s0067 [Porphyra umbilicalis]
MSGAAVFSCRCAAGHARSCTGSGQRGQRGAARASQAPYVPHPAPAAPSTPTPTTANPPAVSPRARRRARVDPPRSGEGGNGAPPPPPPPLSPPPRHLPDNHGCASTSAADGRARPSTCSRYDTKERATGETPAHASSGKRTTPASTSRTISPGEVAVCPNGSRPLRRV